MRRRTVLIVYLSGFISLLGSPGTRASPANGRGGQNSAVFEEVKEFYATHNPEKLEQLPGIMFRYKGRESELLADLHEKYAGLPPYAERKAAAEKAEAEACAAADAAVAAAKASPRRTTVYTTEELRAAVGDQGVQRADVIELDPNGRFFMDHKSLTIDRSITITTIQGAKTKAKILGAGAGGTTTVDIRVPPERTTDKVTVTLENLLIEPEKNKADYKWGEQAAVWISEGSVVLQSCDVVGQVLVRAGASAEINECSLHDSASSGVTAIGGNAPLWDTAVERAKGMGAVALNGGIISFGGDKVKIVGSTAWLLRVRESGQGDYMAGGDPPGRIEGVATELIGDPMAGM